jgi:hypothetical protein
MIIVAYYTPNYKAVYEKYLKQSLDKVFVKHEVVEVLDKGNWSFNTYYTPSILLDALEKHKEMAIKVGVDCFIHEYPKYFEELEKTDFDIAATFTPFDTPDHADISVVIANNTAKAKWFLGQWDRACQDKIKQGIKSVCCDEDVLAEISKQLFPQIKLVKLPYTYGQSWHFDKKEMGFPIIEDFRSSWEHERNKI